jgi:hypothetical protein
MGGAEQKMVDPSAKNKILSNGRRLWQEKTQIPLKLMNQIPI